MTRRAIAQADILAINAVLVSARQAIDMVCDRWTLILLIAAFQGERRFNGFMARTGMASRLLTSRLQALETHGIIVRMPYSMHPVRHEYVLTNMGTDLFEMVLQMARWERSSAAPDSAVGHLMHLPCGTPLLLEVRCRACGQLTNARHIDLKVSRAQIQKVPDKEARHRRSTVNHEDHDAPAQLLGPALDIFGDKWGIEVLICAFFRIHRFNDFREYIGISANILSDRLGRLVGAGLLSQGEDATAQAGYWLTTKGIDVYAIMVTIHEWADKWVRARYRSPVQMIHRGCGSPFLTKMSCVCCAQPVRRSEVDLAPAPHQKPDQRGGLAALGDQRAI